MKRKRRRTQAPRLGLVNLRELQDVQQLLDVLGGLVIQARTLVCDLQMIEANRKAAGRRAAETKRLKAAQAQAEELEAGIHAERVERGI